MKQLLMICFVIVAFLAAAMAQDPVKWIFTAKKLNPNSYELHLTADIQPPWHTYSQLTPPGGPLPTRIIFENNPLVQYDGKIKESGALQQVHDKTFNVDVKYFNNNADFVQVIYVKNKVKTAVNGTLEFMACNDQQCLPPKTIAFKIMLE